MNLPGPARAGPMPERRHGGLGACVVAALLVGLWLAFGVAATEIARFLAYEALLVAVPGVLLYRALAPSPGGLLCHAAVGLALGYAIEVGAFTLTAGLGVRALFPLVPLAVAALAAVGVWRRPGRDEDGPGDRSGSATPLPPAAIWVVAIAIGVALVYLAFDFYAETPLPGHFDSVAYYKDTVRDLSLVVEAKHHWPLTDPSVAGEPLRYHTYAYMDVAGVSQVTGIEPTTLRLRLVPASLLVLIAIQVLVLGRELRRSAWLGPLAVVLVLLIGQLDLDPDRASPLTDGFFFDLSASGSFVFGLPLFLAAATVLIGPLCDREARGPGSWILLLLVLAGCGGAKASILPILFGALVLWLGWAWLSRARRLGAAVVAMVLVAAIAVASYALLYSGGGNNDSSLGLLGFTDSTVIGELVPPEARSALGDAALTGATGLVGAVGLVLPALGLLFVLWYRRLSLDPADAWLLALFLVSLGAFMLISNPGLSQAYFLQYGYVAGCVLSAEGILLFLGRAGPKGAPGLLLGGLLAGALIAGGICAAILHVPGPETAGLGRIAAGFAIVVLAIGALSLWAGRSGRIALPVMGIALLLTISLGALETPLDAGAPIADALSKDKEVYPTDEHPERGITGELYEGLRWVRDHTDGDDLIAVNNHSVDAAGLDSRYFYYTAFAERRAFLESWLYAVDVLTDDREAVAEGRRVAFPERRALNDAAFERADPRALESLADRGVDYLLVDKVHGSASPGLSRLGRPVFENRALTVYRLSPGCCRGGAADSELGARRRNG